MVDLPQPPSNVPISQAPQSSVTPGAVAGQANAWAGLSQTVGDAIDSAAEPWARQEGAASVTRTIDPSTGNPVPVVSQALPVFGHLGDVFKQTQMVTYGAQLQSSMDTGLADMHAKFMLPTDQHGYGGDPALYRSALQSYVQARVDGQPPAYVAMARQIGDQLSGSYFRNAIEEKTRADGVVAKQSLDSLIAQNRTEMSDLAAQGMMNTPAFQQKSDQLDTLMRTKVQDPRMMYSADQAAAERQIDTNTFKAQAILGVARRYYDASGDLRGAMVGAEQDLNPIPMDPTERIRLLGEVSRHLTFRDALRSQGITELNGTADATMEAMSKTHQVDDIAVNDLVSQLRAAKSWKKAADLESVAHTEKLYPSVHNGTPEQAVAALKATYDQVTLANQAGAPIPIQPGQVFATGYSPQLKGDSTEGDYKSSIPGPDGQALVRTLEDVRTGNSKYVTLAGDPSLYGKTYTLPSVTYQANGQTYTLKNVQGVVHDTGPAFQGAPEGRFDIAVGKDLNMAERNQSMSGTQFVPNGSPDSLSSVATKQAIARIQQVYDARATEAWSAMKEGWSRDGGQPSAREFNEISVLYPYISDQNLRTEIATRMQVEGAADKIDQYPLAARASMAAIMHVQQSQGQLNPVARETLARIDQTAKRDQALSQSDPVAYSLSKIPADAVGDHGFHNNATNIQPLDFSSPDMLTAGLQDRQRLVGTMRQTDPSVATMPLSAPDRTQIAEALKLQPAVVSGPILDTLAKTLKPDELQQVIADPTIKSAVDGMTVSADPHRMSAAFGFLGALADKNGAIFNDATMGKDLYQRMRAWQAMSAFQPPDVVAQRMTHYADPSETAARQINEEAAKKTLATVTPQNVISKVWKYWFPSAGTPVDDTGAAGATALKADYDAAFTDFKKLDLSDDQASSRAAEQISKTWGPSAANGGRIMRYPPEQYLVDRKLNMPQTIDGSYDWVKTQLNDDIAQALGFAKMPSRVTNIDPSNGSVPTAQGKLQAEIATDPDKALAYRKAVAEHYLVPDRQTAAEAAAGRVPSYHVVISDASGNLDLLRVNQKDPTSAPMRWRPDFQAAAATQNHAAAYLWRGIKDALGDALTAIGPAVSD